MGPVQRAVGVLGASLLLLTAGDAAAARVTPLDRGAATGGKLRVRVTPQRAGKTFVLSRDGKRGKGDVRVKARTSRKGVATLRIPEALKPGAWRVIACRGVRCTATPKAVWFVRGYVNPRRIDVTSTIDSERAATAVLHRDGGTLTTTGADGTAFTLTIPDGALAAESTEITMTPISAVTGVPIEGTLAGGVRLEPHGLTFYRTVTLDIAPAAPPTQPVLAAFGTLGAGRDIHLEPSEPLGASGQRVPLTHFSDHLGWATTAGGLNAANARTPGSREAWAVQNAQQAVADERERQVAGGQARDVYYSAASVGFFVQANERIGPLLLAAERNPTLAEVAAQEFLAWSKDMEMSGVLNETPENAKTRKQLLDLRDDMQEILDRIVKARLSTARRRCFDEKRPEAVQELLDAERLLELAGFPLAESVLLEAEACNTWELRFDSVMTARPADADSGAYNWHMHGTASIPSRVIDREVLWQGPLEHVSVGGTTTGPDECPHNGEVIYSTKVSELQSPGASGLMNVAEFYVRRFAGRDGAPQISLELQPGQPTETYVTHHDIGTPCESFRTVTLPIWPLEYYIARSLTGTIASDFVAPRYRFYSDWQKGTGDVYATWKKTVTQVTIQDSNGSVDDTTTIDLLFTPKPRPKPQPEQRPS